MSEAKNKSTNRQTRCPHVVRIGDVCWEDVWSRKQMVKWCETCGSKTENLWLCLDGGCLNVGCGYSERDDSEQHSIANNHVLCMNLSNERIWCTVCSEEVMPNNIPRFSLSDIPDKRQEPSKRSPAGAASKSSNSPTAESSGQGKSDTRRKVDEASARGASVNSASKFDRTVEQGLGSGSESNVSSAGRRQAAGTVGLLNMGNTCYMNAALQALSNCQPLCDYFLHCPTNLSRDSNSLAGAFTALLSDIWQPSGHMRFLLPKTVLDKIRRAYPIFQGHSQHDSQEFLRCFLDLLNEELRRPVYPFLCDCVSDDTYSEAVVRSRCRRASDASDYDTCDSGLSTDEEEEDMEEQNSEDIFLEAADVFTVDISAELKEDSGETMSNLSSTDSGYGRAEAAHSDSLSRIPGRTNESSAAAETVETCSRLPQDRSAATCGASYTPDSASVNPGHEANVAEKGKTIDSSSGIRNVEPKATSDDRLHNSKTTGNNSTSPATRRKIQKYSSIISEVFDGQMINSVECLACHQISCSLETYHELTVPIPSESVIPPTSEEAESSVLTSDSKNLSAAAVGSTAGSGIASDRRRRRQPMRSDAADNDGAVLESGSWIWQTLCSVVGWFWQRPFSLADCLVSYFSAEELKDENRYYCERCKCLRNGLKFSQILKLPEILCVQLNRFKQQVNYISKIESYVSFPVKNLEMSPYLHPDAKNQTTVYDLVSVICHDGNTRGGHYTAYGMNYSTGQWFDFNDDYVIPVSPNTVANCEAYILFYRKRNPDAEFYQSWYSECERNDLELEHRGNASRTNFYYISTHWLHRFWTFADPGPITNQDFLCPHLDVQANIWPLIENFVTPVSENMWNHLIQWFGGGPAVTRLAQCQQCKQEIEQLSKRQRTEKETVWRMYDEYKERKEPTGHIYALSLSWFERWRMFSHGNTSEIPGPIDNTSICVQKSVSSEIVTLRPHIHCAKLSDDQWFYLVGIYGGGPAVIATFCPTPPPQPQKSSASSEDPHEYSLPPSSSNNSMEQRKSSDDIDLESAFPVEDLYDKEIDVKPVRHTSKENVTKDSGDSHQDVVLSHSKSVDCMTSMNGQREQLQCDDLNKLGKRLSDLSLASVPVRARARSSDVRPARNSTKVIDPTYHHSAYPTKTVSNCQTEEFVEKPYSSKILMSDESSAEMIARGRGSVSGGMKLLDAQDKQPLACAVQQKKSRSVDSSERDIPPRVGGSHCNLLEGKSEYFASSGPKPTSNLSQNNESVCQAAIQQDHGADLCPSPDHKSDAKVNGYEMSNESVVYLLKKDSNVSANAQNRLLVDSETNRKEELRLGNECLHCRSCKNSAAADALDVNGCMCEKVVVSHCSDAPVENFKTRDSSLLKHQDDGCLPKKSCNTIVTHASDATGAKYSSAVRDSSCGDISSSIRGRKVCDTTEVVVNGTLDQQKPYTKDMTVKEPVKSPACKRSSRSKVKQGSVGKTIDGLDTCIVATECDTVSTCNDVVSTRNDVVSTRNDGVSTGNDIVLTRNDGVSTRNDVVSTGYDDMSTGNDVVSTRNDDVSTGNDDASTRNDDVEQLDNHWTGLERKSHFELPYKA